MQQGSVIARVYTSDAYLPLEHVPVVFTQINPDGTEALLAVRDTSSSGLTAPVFVDTPETSASMTPGSSIRPYATITIRAGKPGYSSIVAEGVQVFPGVETIQGLQLLPVTPENKDSLTTIVEDPQNL